MPPIFDRNKLLRSLGVVYDSLYKRHNTEQRAIGNKTPIGGGDWMDTFFQLEGLRGVITALRQGKTLSYAIQFGKGTSSAAVKIWNDRREYQVHRCEETAHDFIENTVRRMLHATNS